MQNADKTRFGRAKIACTLISTLFLAGCGVGEPLALGATATTSFIMEDKLPTDYVAEVFTGKDCSYVRRLEDGGPLCRSQDYGQVIEKPVYCYKSLGNVTCYERPDPYGDGTQPVQ